MTENSNISSQRKKDHLELALKSRIGQDMIDDRFYYEPIMQGHPSSELLLRKTFLGKVLRTPIWVSSMTGGTLMAKTINHNLARACKDFGMGMGLGSCRSLLYSDDHLPDFNVRDMIGDDLPLYGNLGIAQIEKLIETHDFNRIDTLIKKLQLDGLILHINPLQEWFQPEGDQILKPPIDTIMRLLDVARYPVIVKEVGQGMGKESLAALLRLPLAAVDFAASGGTNFALLELLRSKDLWREELQSLTRVGHSAFEMVAITNQLIEELAGDIHCKEVIISGGIDNFLDGYYLMNKIKTSAIYGQASAFLKHAMESYDQLHKFVETQVEGLSMAQTYLRVK